MSSKLRASLRSGQQLANEPLTENIDERRLVDGRVERALVRLGDIC